MRCCQQLHQFCLPNKNCSTSHFSRAIIFWRVWKISWYFRSAVHACVRRLSFFLSVDRDDMKLVELFNWADVRDDWSYRAPNITGQFQVKPVLFLYIESQTWQSRWLARSLDQFEGNRKLWTFNQIVFDGIFFSGCPVNCLLSQALLRAPQWASIDRLSEEKKSSFQIDWTLPRSMDKMPPKCVRIIMKILSKQSQIEVVE